MANRTPPTMMSSRNPPAKNLIMTKTRWFFRDPPKWYVKKVFVSKKHVVNLARWNYPADDGGGEVPRQKASFGSDVLTADPSWKSQMDSDYLRMMI